MALVVIIIPAALVALLANIIDRPSGESYLERFLSLALTMVICLSSTALWESCKARKK